MAPNLPAHLQQYKAPNLTSRALDGIGTSLPPHVSIQGNTFTLIDSIGNEQAMGPTMEACVIDISDVTCKRYYPQDKKWSPDAGDAPICFSMNGIGPSRDAQTPQSPTCASCEWNVRGSAQSQLSGAAIKACRDEKQIALLFPNFPTMLFRLTVTPGSFKTWGDYVKQFEQHQVNLADVLTSFSFKAKANGVLEFKPSAQIWIDAPTAEARAKALDAKATDILVGRLDRPVGAALAGPIQAAALQAPAQPAEQPAPTPGFGGSPPQAAPFGSGSATAASTEPPKRTRRTKAQIEADNAAMQAGQSFRQADQPTPGATPAPFRMATAPAQGASPFGASAPNGGAFGMQQGVAPNPELEGALKTAFDS